MRNLDIVDTREKLFTYVKAGVLAPVERDCAAAPAPETNARTTTRDCEARD